MTLDRFYSKPNFYLRRLHQISIALFYEETGKVGITPTQFTVLYVLRDRPGIDQETVSQLAALDKVTTVKVIARLKDRELITKSRSLRDRRASVLELTAKGRKTVERMEPMLDRSAARLIAPLTTSEQATLIKLLSKLAEHNNSLSRAPLNLESREKDKRSRGGAPFGSSSLKSRFLDSRTRTEP